MSHNSFKEKLPDPDTLYPLENYHKLVYLKNIITRNNISVGDYTYYDDLNDPYNFEKNVLYHFDFIGDKLIIGKFCSIASGVQFIMNGGNHETAPFSSYPFGIFPAFHEIGLERQKGNCYPNKGDTVIKNDVWLGMEAVVLPGVTIGNGAIIAAKSVVTKNIPDYAITAGNPAVVVKMRFDDNTINRLLKIKWWDWNVENISKNIRLILGNNIDELEKILNSE